MDARVVEIEAVTIDEVGRLLVRPSPPAVYDQIYRAALGVGWDPPTRSLVTPTPEEGSYFRWFRRIVDAVRSEYGQHLCISEITGWQNVSLRLRTEINNWSGGTLPNRPLQPTSGGPGQVE